MPVGQGSLGKLAQFRHSVLHCWRNRWSPLLNLLIALIYVHLLLPHVDIAMGTASAARKCATKSLSSNGSPSALLCMAHACQVALIEMSVHEDEVSALSRVEECAT